MRGIRFFSAIALAACSTGAIGQATLFIPKRAGYAWWANDMLILPQAKADGGLTLADIDAWRASHRGMRDAPKVCFMNFLRDKEIVSPDRATLDDIKSTLAQYPSSFSQTIEPKPGVKFLVRVGLFEDCQEGGAGQPPTRYMALVITDAAGKIRHFDPLEWQFIRLYKNDDGSLSVFGCFDCGEVQVLSWDQGNDRFYFTWAGH